MSRYAIVAPIVLFCIAVWSFFATGSFVIPSIIGVSAFALGAILRFIKLPTPDFKLRKFRSNEDGRPGRFVNTRFAVGMHASWVFGILFYFTQGNAAGTVIHWISALSPDGQIIMAIGGHIGGWLLTR